MTQQTRFSIVDGPSKFDLMVALFKRDEEIEFTLRIDEKKTHKIGFIVNGLSNEDGTREGWLIHGRGFCINFPELSLSHENWQRFEGYYMPRDRSGWMENVSLKKK